MRNSSLRSALDKLAQSFTAGVLAAIRGASIEDLRAESSATARRGAGRPRAAVPAASPAPAGTTKGGRLARRSADDIGRAVDQVVALVKQSKSGLRSEEIKKMLGLDRREVPRILKTGVQTKRLKAKGHKRATVYSAT